MPFIGSSGAGAGPGGELEHNYIVILGVSCSNIVQLLLL